MVDVAYRVRQACVGRRLRQIVEKLGCVAIREFHPIVVKDPFEHVPYEGANEIRQKFLQKFWKFSHQKGGKPGETRISTAVFCKWLCIPCQCANELTPWEITPLIRPARMGQRIQDEKHKQPHVFLVPTRRRPLPKNEPFSKSRTPLSSRFLAYR